MNREVAKLFAKLFIARSDVKAQQRSSGEYNPTVDRDSSGTITKMYPFTMPDLLDHIEGRRSYGHYFLNPDNQCKLFAFDVDLDELKPDKPDSDLVLPFTQDNTTVLDEELISGLKELRDLMGSKDCEIPSPGWRDFAPADPRSIWLNRSMVPARNYLKYQMRTLASMLARTIHEEFDMQTAVTYTGTKGIHVYGFTGLMPATEVRAGAEYVLEKLGCFEPHFGSNFFKHKKFERYDGTGGLEHEFSNRCFTIEIFPKQTVLKDGGFGNLMRLPLGKNLKNPNDPTFFVDMRTPLTELKPRDALEALTAKDQWL